MFKHAARPTNIVGDTALLTIVFGEILKELLRTPYKGNAP